MSFIKGHFFIFWKSRIFKIGDVSIIKLAELEGFKSGAQFQVNQVPGGAIYFIMEGETITWKLSSDIFDIKMLQVGSKVLESSAERGCMKAKKTLTSNIHNNKYGIHI